LGNIIISDEKSSEIIVLTKHGGRKCLLTNRLQRVGLNLTPHFYRPSSLGLDSDGKLWVLQKQGITVVDLYSQWMPTVPRPPLIANTPR
jgi:ligand-binding sensor domain-containing protein